MQVFPLFFRHFSVNESPCFTGKFPCFLIVSASKEGVVLFPPPIDILGKTNIF